MQLAMLPLAQKSLLADAAVGKGHMQGFQDLTVLRLSSPPELLAGTDMPCHLRGLEGLKTALRSNLGNGAEPGWQTEGRELQ